MSTFFLLALFAMVLLGVPLAIAFALSVFLFISDFRVPISALGAIPYEAVAVYPLVAIPLFLMLGEIMNEGGLSRRLMAVCDRIFKRLSAAYGYIMVGASALFGSITGSSVATVAAMGTVVGPQMTARGYPRGYTAALNACAGLLGVLLPPSIPLILYGSVVGTSITQLFLATLVPALLMAVAFALVHTFRAKSVLPGGKEIQPEEPVGTRIRTRSLFLGSAPTLLLPVIVMGGIYGGLFTPTEAAAVGCVLAILITIAHRALTTQNYWSAVSRAAVSAGAVLIIIALTSVFNRVLILNQIPQELATVITGLIESKIAFLIAVNLILLAVGMFMETNAAILLMGPLLAPVAHSYGIDPVHFGIVLVTNLELGLLTPPLAANLFVAARTNSAKFSEMLAHMGWFMGVALIVLLMVTFVPLLTLWYRWL